MIVPVIQLFKAKINVDKIVCYFDLLAYDASY